jgi:hypothetical protein
VREWGEEFSKVTLGKRAGSRNVLLFSLRSFHTAPEGGDPSRTWNRSPAIVKITRSRRLPRRSRRRNKVEICRRKSDLARRDLLFPAALRLARGRMRARRIGISFHREREPVARAFFSRRLASLPRRFRSPLKIASTSRVPVARAPADTETRRERSHAPIGTLIVYELDQFGVTFENQIAAMDDRTAADLSALASAWVDLYNRGEKWPSEASRKQASDRSPSG